MYVYPNVVINSEINRKSRKSGQHRIFPS